MEQKLAEDIRTKFLSALDTASENYKNVNNVNINSNEKFSFNEDKKRVAKKKKTHYNEYVSNALGTQQKNSSWRYYSIK